MKDDDGAARGENLGDTTPFNRRRVRQEQSAIYNDGGKSEIAMAMVIECPLMAV